MLDSERRNSLLWEFQHNRPLAHQYLFAHRHKDEDPAFHRELLALLYDPHPQVACMAFRGGGKSTYLEEYLLLSALFKEFLFALIVGPKEESAAERLSPIRMELETNEQIIELFGDQKSTPWSTTELVLANGVKLQAIGAGQSMRGKKHNDERPDLAAIDDLEDEDSIRTEESRRKTKRWMTGTLQPALNPKTGRIRFVGTAIHPKSLIFTTCQNPEWKSRVFPAVYNDLETGEEKSAWPARFPLEWLHKKRQEYLGNGDMIEWQQEYMCISEDISGKPFQSSMITESPAPVSLRIIEMMVDPARTTDKKRSARTGYAAWEWIGNSIVVHRAEGHFDKPDAIVDRIVQWEEQLHPVEIGVEADGLEEFLMQPLRVRMQQLGRSMPIVAMHAPKNKEQFIQGLQPFYISGSITHAGHFPDLVAELLQFPTGRIDVPNALAYALKMRAGRPVYEDFTIRHVTPILEPSTRQPRYLVVSARPALTAAALVQYVDGVIKIYRDWVCNEPPQECFGRILREAVLVSGQVKVAAPKEQFDQFTNAGLPAAVKKEHLLASQTTLAAKTEGQLRTALRQQLRGEVALLVHEEARWTIGGLARGYARKLDKRGQLSPLPVDNQYRVLIEAIESWVAWFDTNNTTLDMTDQVRYARTEDGRQYISLRP